MYIIPLIASATPSYLFTNILGILYGSGGLGKAGRSYSADEFIAVEGYRLLDRSLITLLCLFTR